VVFIGFLGYSLMITVFTPMILHAHGGMISATSSTGERTILLGILLCLYPLGQFFGSPVMGALSDRFGRKRVLLASLCITTTAYVFIALALSIGSPALLGASSLIAGLSEANVVIAQSAIADVTTTASRSRFFGYIYISASLAYVVGPLFGGKLADPSLVAWFDYATPFWAVFGLLVATTVWTFLVFDETRRPGVQQEVRYLDAFTSLLSVATDRRLRIFYLVNFLLYLAIFGFFRSYPMYLVDEFHLGVSALSEFIAWVAVPIVIANLWATGFLASRFAPRAITFWSACLLAPLMVVIVIPDSQNALWVTLFLAAFALAICLPACATMLSVAVGEAEQGRVMGNNQSLQVGAEALSGLVCGLLAALLVPLPLLVLAAIALLAAIVLRRSGRRAVAAAG
jgi:DHA1 family tetracycline resistance protein-like MFS transporter